MERAIDLIHSESPIWAMEPTRFTAFVSSVARHLDSGLHSQATLGALLSAGERSRAATRHIAPYAGAALIPVLGPLSRRSSAFSDMFGMSNYASLRAQVAQAAANPNVDRVVFLVDSPGGDAQGVEELSNEIAVLGKSKQTVAYVDGDSGSAAFWIAASANRILITPSGSAGSIGVFAIHASYEKALAADGVEVSIVVSKVSPQKVDGNMFQTLGADARARIQADVDTIAGTFVAAVARGRGVSLSTVASTFGRGSMLFAGPARTAGMIDEIGPLERALSVSAPARPARLDALKTSTGNHAELARRRRLDLLRAS